VERIDQRIGSGELTGLGDGPVLNPAEASSTEPTADGAWVDPWQGRGVDGFTEWGDSRGVTMKAERIPHVNALGGFVLHTAQG
jgi:hypothetical protein